MTKEEILAYKELENLLVKLEKAGYRCSFHTDLPKKLLVLNIAAKEGDMTYLGQRIGIVNKTS